MADSDTNPSESETIMLALDQISQTIEVMTSVVGRLRNYVEQQERSAAKKSTEEPDIQPDRILH